MVAGDDESYPVVDGIPDFVHRRGRDRFGESIVKGAYVSRNWQTAYDRAKSGQPDPFMGALIADHGGLILEIAAGPGGGNMPSTLAHGPDAKVLVNDLSLLVLQEWRRVLAASGVGHNLSFAAFDIRRMPLASGAVDTVSNAGGITNVHGQGALMREVRRVLKPGGRLFSLELEVKPNDWSRLPLARRAAYERLHPAVRGFTRLFEEHGLTIEKHEVMATKDLDAGQDDLEGMAREYGAHLRADIVRTVAVRR